MLTLELTNDASALLAAFDGAEPLFSGLRLLSRAEQNLDVALTEITTGKMTNDAAERIQFLFATVRNALPEISHRSFFRSLDQTAVAIDKYASSNVDNALIVASLNERLEEYSLNFEAFLSDQSAVRALPVVREGTHLLVQLLTLRRTLTGVVAQLTNAATLLEDEEVFSIFFFVNNLLMRLLQS